MKASDFSLELPPCWESIGTLKTPKSPRLVVGWGQLLPLQPRKTIPPTPHPIHVVPPPKQGRVACLFLAVTPDLKHLKSPTDSGLPGEGCSLYAPNSGTQKLPVRNYHVLGIRSTRGYLHPREAWTHIFQGQKKQGMSRPAKKTPTTKALALCATLSPSHERGPGGGIAIGSGPETL